MAIPGLKPSFEVRAKVRVGVKATSQGGKEYPKSVDYFVSEGWTDQPKELTVLLPFERPEDNFSTGLEQWAGQMLVCYTKGETVNGQPVAFRKKTLKRGSQVVDLLKDFTVVGEQMGNERMPVACLARECHMMKAKDGCKPMGRLQFFIKGEDPALGVYQLDTKSWNSIEKIEAFLSVLGDPRGKELTLRVEMWSKGTSKFPVVTLEGGNVVMVIDNDADVTLADALLQLVKALELHEHGSADLGVHRALCDALDISNPGWRDVPEFIARIKEVGAVEAAKGLLARNGL